MDYYDDVRNVSDVMLSLRKCSMRDHMFSDMCMTILENLPGKKPYTVQEMTACDPRNVRHFLQTVRLPVWANEPISVVDAPKTCEHAWVPFYFGALRLGSIAICHPNRILFIKRERDQHDDR